MPDTSTTITATAADGKRMTIAELRDFLNTLDGAPNDTEIKVTATFGAHIKKITATYAV